MSSQPALAPVPVPEPLPPLEVGKAPVLSTARSYWRFFFFVLFLAALFLPVRYMDPLYRLPQFNRFMALALFALSVDMIWGYTGLLSLGQGLYFGIGAYIMAWSLKLQQAAMAASEAAEPELIKLDRYLLKPGVMTDYMEQCRLPEVPSWIAPLINVWLAIPLAIILPTILAFAFGFIVFKRRIKGVYFSLITQGARSGRFSLGFEPRPYTGGVDGQTNLAGLDLFGIDFEDAKRMFYLVTGILVFFALICYFLVNSKFGKILTAIRDNEFRVMALGYNTAMFKTVVFALSGLMAGLAGALFVAANQSAGPQFFSIGESIEVVIFVAVGGRGTLVGAILGALLVNWGKDHINNAFSTWWPVVLGGLFVAVVLFLPEGIVGGVPRFFKFVRLWFQRRPGLSTRWNVVRIGFGLMYWGIVAVLLASSLVVIVAFTSRRALPATPEELFGGVFGSICYWTLVIGAFDCIRRTVCLLDRTPGRPRQAIRAGLGCLPGRFRSDRFPRRVGASGRIPSRLRAPRVRGPAPSCLAGARPCSGVEPGAVCPLPARRGDFLQARGHRQERARLRGPLCRLPGHQRPPELCSEHRRQPSPFGAAPLSSGARLRGHVAGFAGVVLAAVVQSARVH